MRPLGPDGRPFPLSGAEAQRFGAITTLENSAGQVIIFHRAGKVIAAIEDAFRTATALDESFRVVSVSTPTTIYRDMSGGREIGTGPNVQWGSQAVQLPEQSYCGGARKQMLHPRLRGSADKKGRYRQ